MQTAQRPDLYEPLSKRECEILALMAENCPDREIAARLILGHNTVKWHNRQIFQKLGVKNRRQAVKCAVMLGVLDTKTEQPGPSHNLPSQLTPFVGRISELEELIRLFSANQPRLLTLLAPGGMGKTRLALALAETLLAQFPDGVYFAALTPLDSHDVLVPAIAEAVGCPLFADDRTPMQHLCDFLRRKHVLLILDDFEHLLDSAPVVSALLQAAPGLKVIVTSRERLNLTGESVYPVDGLRYPVGEVPENAGEYGAVQLFAQAAFRANPHFSAPVADIVRVCRLVQGMPLALELAAGWASALTTAEIAAEVTRSADFLQTSLRDVPDRLRSIRAVFEAAWARLSAAEQRAFAALSVFRGGCTREAALAVTRSTDAVLAALVDKALLSRSPKSGRYDIHELLRQYAAERLAESGNEDTVCVAHQAYFAAFVERWTEGLKHDLLSVIDTIDADFENIRLAFERAIADGTPDALLPFSTLFFYFHIRGAVDEGTRLMGAGIAALGDTDSLALANLLIGMASLYQLSWSYERMNEPARRAVEILRRLGLERELPPALNQWGFVFYAILKDKPQAMSVWHEGYAIARKYNDDWDVAYCAYIIGMTSCWDERWDEARPWLIEAHGAAVRTGNAWGLCFILWGLAELAFRAGDDAEAKRFIGQSAELGRRMGFSKQTLTAHRWLYEIALRGGDLKTARWFARDVVAFERHIGRDSALYPSLLAMAETCLMAGEIAESRTYLREALQIVGSASTELRLHTLRIAADQFVSSGAYSDALTLLTFAAAYPHNMSASPRHSAHIDELIGQCHAALSADQAAAIAEATAQHTLDSMLAIVAASL